jgi:hypothetical protein
VGLAVEGMRNQEIAVKLNVSDPPCGTTFSEFSTSWDIGPCKLVLSYRPSVG